MTIYNDLYVNPSLYVNGFLVNLVRHDNNIAMYRGECRDSTNSNDIVLSGEIRLSKDKIGVNGLDEAPVAPINLNNRFLAVYVIADSLGYNPTAGLLSLHREHPVLPEGYDMFRRVSWIAINPVGEYYYWSQYGTSNTRTYYYETEITVKLDPPYASVMTELPLFSTEMLSGGGNAYCVPANRGEIYCRFTASTKTAFQSFGVDQPTSNNGNGLIRYVVPTATLTNVDIYNAWVPSEYVDFDTPAYLGATIQYKLEDPAEFNSFTISVLGFRENI
jgi:hypothetical protein